jgi:hypothetical protein
MICCKVALRQMFSTISSLWVLRPVGIGIIV